MDCDTGHLIEMSNEDMMKRIGEKYEPVPEHLETQAKLELAGRKECYIGKNSSGSLSKHMRYKRRKKQQIAKASRRKNRSYTS